VLKALGQLDTACPQLATTINARPALSVLKLAQEQELSLALKALAGMRETMKLELVGGIAQVTYRI